MPLLHGTTRVEETSINDNDWNQAAEQQRQKQMEQDTLVTSQNSQNVLGQLENIVNADIAAQRQKRAMNDAVVGSTMILARQNNGFLPASVLPSVSESLGMPISGGSYGDDGTFYLWSTNKDGKPSPIAMATPEMQYSVLKRSKLGLDIQSEIYGNLSKKFTPEQLAKKGITDPNAPENVGSVTVRGGVFANALGYGQKRSSISAFGANGKGGFTNYESNEGTGYTLQSADSGTRAEAPRDAFERGETDPRAREANELARQRSADFQNLDDKGKAAALNAEARAKYSSTQQGSGLSFEERSLLQQQKDDALRERAMMMAERQMQNANEATKRMVKSQFLRQRERREKDLGEGVVANGEGGYRLRTKEEIAKELSEWEKSYWSDYADDVENGEQKPESKPEPKADVKPAPRPMMSREEYNATKPKPKPTPKRNVGDVFVRDGKKFVITKIDDNGKPKAQLLKNQ